MEKRCDNCDFSIMRKEKRGDWAHAKVYEIFTCRRYPRVIEVDADFWCGEFRPKKSTSKPEPTAKPGGGTP